MRKLSFMLIAAIAATMASCIGGNEGKWQNEKDSVMNVNEQQRQVLDDLTSSLIEVSASIDSIAAGEGMLRDASEGPVLTKEQMLENLAAFKATLEENKSKLAELEKKLAGREDELAKLGKLVKYLNGELEAKQQRIAQLEEELQSANANIDRMRGEMNNLNTAIGSLQDENEQQRRAIESQDAALNEGYYIMGTSRELKEKGLTSGGNIFKKKKVEFDNIDKSLFVKVDIRNVTQINIPSKKAKVLTNAPTDSYTISRNGNSSVLQIRDVARFWSLSRYLIIQTD